MTDHLNPLTRVARALARFQIALAGVAVLLMMVNITVDVLASRMFGRGIDSTLEFVTYYYMIAAAFLPLAAVEMNREYLIVDLFVDMCPRGVRSISEFVRITATFAAYALLAWLTFDVAMRSYRTGEIVLGAHVIYVWPARFLLPLAFVTAALVSLAEALDKVIGQLSFRLREQSVE